MSDYPEIDKMTAIQDKSQSIGEFLDWLKETKDITFAKYPSDGEFLTPVFLQKTTLLAEFFNIDLSKVEEERRQIIKKLREKK